MQKFIDDFWRIFQFSITEDDFAQRLEYISRVIQNPQSDIPVAIFLLAIATLTVLIIISFVIAIIMRAVPSETSYALIDNEGNLVRELSAKETRQIAEETTGGKQAKRQWARKKFDRNAAKLVSTIVVWAGIVLITAAITGNFTRSNAFCNSCHGDRNHSSMLEVNKHGDVLCVDCHETGGMIQSFTTNVPGRVIHTAATFLWNSSTSYTFFPRESCLRCHPRESLEGTVRDGSIAMRHEHPLEAGFTCIQCHDFSPTQEFAYPTRGMQTCLRCHDGENARLTCTLCHRPSLSEVPRTELHPENTAQRLLQGIDFQQGCYRCHDPAPCDACHGVRVPHEEGYTNAPHVSDTRRLGYQACLLCHTKSSPTGIMTCDDDACHIGIWDALGISNPEP